MPPAATFQWAATKSSRLKSDCLLQYCHFYDIIKSSSNGRRVLLACQEAWFDVQSLAANNKKIFYINSATEILNYLETINKVIFEDSFQMETGPKNLLLKHSEYFEVLYVWEVLLGQFNSF